MYVDVRNSTLVQPLVRVVTRLYTRVDILWFTMQCNVSWLNFLPCSQDNFNYTSYWVGIQASPIPQVRALADWQTEMTFSGSLVGVGGTQDCMRCMVTVCMIRHVQHACADSALSLPCTGGLS